ncbi:hypothetical protein [Alienimonas californiensis]|uniref:Uncharacterized protein n=1 Tax=Alienimonas californiensis TaxID=2527989 RepID=A0A517P4S7_9PLAN|nr:hypothetical protein [Alienimonas californiensis]QDT14380.1 hypothetical protein CA12_04530 [Alienimonas californiensis]
MTSSPESGRAIVCEDRSFAPPDRPRATIDPARGVVIFERCHVPRNFLSAGVEGVREVPFAEIRSARELRVGGGRGLGLRALLGLGRVAGMTATSAGSLASIFIGTVSGRARVFAHWHNFPAFREAILPIAAESPQGGALEDNPLVGAAVAVAMLAVTAGIVWWLL